jgi:ABC-type glycerol-3-phosphate transport system substrate-binding protein
MLVVAALSVGAAQAGGKAPVKLKFYTFAWQPPTVAATKSIVAAWNAKNPNIQVEIVPGDPNSVHDFLLTSFVGGSAADIIHDEAADIASFAGQGYLADMTKLVPPAFKASIPAPIWASSTFNGKVRGAPYLLQTYNVFVNVPMLKAAGIAIPKPDNPWTWAQFRQVAKTLTKSGQYGVGWGLKSPAALFMTTSMAFKGKYFYGTGSNTRVQFGSLEQQVPRRVHAMIYEDKSIDPATVGQSGSAVLPGFFAGKYAMTVQGNFSAQGMVNSAPAGFNWAMLPVLKGINQGQAANPQTLSISQQSKHKAQAMAFISYFLNKDNMAQLAAGDWLIPSNPKAGPWILRTQGHKGSWRIALGSIPSLVPAPFVSLTGYARWKDQVAQPAFREYLANKITLEQLGAKLESGWTP